MKTKVRTIILMTFITAGVLCVCVPVGFGDEKYKSDSKTQVKKIKEIRAEISLLNLLNGLYLSDEQSEELIPLAEEAVELRRKHRDTLAKHSDSYFLELGELRDGLYQPAGPKPEAKQKATASHAELEKKPLQELVEQLGVLEDKARLILSDAQVAIVEDFKPCLIPPKNLRDPVAVGQASTTKREKKMLDMVRRMPDELYAEKKNKIAEFIVKEAEHQKGEVPDDVRTAMVNLYCWKMEKIRRMTGDVACHHGKHKLCPISQYLLSEQAAEVLKKFSTARKQGPAVINMKDMLEGERIRMGGRYGGRMYKRYRNIAELLIQERRESDMISKEDIRKLKGMLRKTYKLSDEDENFKIIDKVADELNSKAVTTKSFELVMTKIIWLSREKKVEGILGMRNRYPDITGLREMIADAKEKNKAGQYKAGYEQLVKVVHYLESFKD